MIHQRPALARLAEALFDGGEPGRGDDVANHVTLEGRVVHDGVGRLQVSDDAAVLTLPPRLFLVLIVKLSLAGDCLPIVHSRGTSNALHTVLALDAFDVDLQMKLPHARHDGLLGLGVEPHPEGGVLPHEPAQRLGELVQAALLGGLQGKGHDCFGYVHRRHGQLGFAVGKSVAGGALNAKHGDNLSRLCLVNVLHVVTVHPY
mmetsp:Transcript_1182/g.2820  ORF Transcript_1182/g.2820 Transcript_1182/m.2820 type:complete len:203 (-) Transcript_1182:1133-1741(-)